MTAPGVGGVLLAAGGGSRFGGPKALARLHGELLVERGARLLADGGCRPVVVVLGAAAAAVAARARLGNAEVVINPDWRSGMGSSLRAGLAALEGRCTAAVIALADQPRVGPEAIRRLVAAWRRGAPAAVATYGGRPRNPVLVGRGLWPEVVGRAGGDVGARAFLRDHAEVVAAVACDDTGSPDDVDSPEDLAALAGRVPPREEQACS